MSGNLFLPGTLADFVGFFILIYCSRSYLINSANFTSARAQRIVFVVVVSSLLIDRHCGNERRCHYIATWMKAGQQLITVSIIFQVYFVFFFSIQRCYLRTLLRNLYNSVCVAEFYFSVFFFSVFVALVKRATLMHIVDTVQLYTVQAQRNYYALAWHNTDGCSQVHWKLPQ